jgi:enoyl-CoA hydratase
LTAYVDTSVDGHVALLSLDRPEARNALSPEVMEEIANELERLDGIADVRCLVIAGSDEVFASGADIKAMSERSLAESLYHPAAGFWKRLAAIKTPMIAAVSGWALGGGCELALACHVRVASENARLGTPEVKLGIMCGYAGTQRLPRLIGKGRALEMLLTGEMVGAQDALRIGLVNRVVTKESLLAEAETLLRQMLANGPVSLRFTLEAVNAGLEMPLDEAQYLEATLFGLICTTEDMKEGTKAFLEKRPAKFQGK